MNCSEIKLPKMKFKCYSGKYRIPRKKKKTIKREYRLIYEWLNEK